MFFSPSKDGEEAHMPDCDDFVVFHVRKNKTLKAFRLFQCHCQRIQKVEGRRRKQVTQITQRNKKNIPDTFQVLQEMVQHGNFEGVPSHIFSQMTNDYGEKKQMCMKVFRSMNKFFSHQRTHTNEKPYACSIDGCGLKFNQKGNLKTHLK